MARRPAYSPAEIDSQLQSIYLSADFLPTHTDSLENLAPVLRNVQSSRQHDAYLRQLQSFIAGKDAEIEQVCKANYQDFVASTDRLLKIRKGTVSLRHRIVELNDDIQDKGGDVAARKHDLIATRRVASNIDSAIVTLQATLGLLDLYAKIDQLIAEERYVPALRSLYELQDRHIKPLLHLPLASHILSKIPATQQQIKTQVTKQLKSWLFVARSESASVGRRALSNMDTRMRRWHARVHKDHPSASPRSLLLGGPIELGVDERYEFNPLDPEAVNIDFRPLYHCIHVYDTLGARKELQQSYQHDRQAQAQLLLTQAASGDFLSNPSSLFEEIAGFFIIEVYVLRTTPNSFRSIRDVEMLWEEVCEKLVQLLSERLSKCKDNDVMSSVKQNTLLLTHTFEMYDLSAKALQLLLSGITERYLHLIQSSLQTDMEQTVREDDNQAMLANSADEREKVVQSAWLPPHGEWSRETIESQPLPCVLPFSQMYPLCCVDLRNFLEQYHIFSGDLASPFAKAKADEGFLKSVNNLLVNYVGKVIHRRAMNTGNLSQLAQMIINIIFFQMAMDGITSELQSSSGQNSGSQTKAQLNEQMISIQELVIKSINTKMDEFLEQAEYQWTAAEPPKDNHHPSDYLVDLSSYLTLVLDSILVQLPSFVRTVIHHGVLKHVAGRFMSFVTNSSLRSLSEAGFAHFANDIQYIKTQNSQTAIDDEEDDAEDDAFEELSQIATLLQGDTYQDFMDQDLRQMAYSAILPKNLESILMKMVNYLNTLPSTSPRLDYKRKRMTEDLLKALVR